MKKILFTDLDGTLLKTDKTISEKNREAIRQMLDAGNCVVITTGRVVSSAYKVAKKLGLTMPGCYMIAANGAVIYDCAAQRVVKEWTIPMEYVRYLFAEAERYGIHIQTYSDQFMLTSCNSRELEYYVSKTDTPTRLVEDVFAVLKQDPNKILLANIDDSKILKQFQRDHLQWEQGRISSFFSCPQYLEYCPPGVDKGSGVRFLCSYLDIPIENAYAVGDERNDIPMIKAAGVGIAMKNAHEETKAAADYVTEHDNDHDAIAEIIYGRGLTD